MLTSGKKTLFLQSFLRGVYSFRVLKHATLAQLVEQLTCNQ